MTRSWWMTHIAAALLGIEIVAARIFAWTSVAVSFGFTVAYGLAIAALVVVGLLVVGLVIWPLSVLAALAGGRR